VKVRVNPRQKNSRAAQASMSAAQGFIRTAINSLCTTQIDTGDHLRRIKNEKRKMKNEKRKLRTSCDFKVNDGVR
jgi:hypothetical protein